MKYCALTILLTLSSVFLFAQDKEEYDEILLNDPAVRIIATEAVNQMYDFKFEEAEKKFQWLKSDYPDHPLSYFLM